MTGGAEIRRALPLRPSRSAPRLFAIETKNSNAANSCAKTAASRWTGNQAPPPLPHHKRRRVRLEIREIFHPLELSNIFRQSPRPFRSASESIPNSAARSVQCVQNLRRAAMNVRKPRNVQGSSGQSILMRRSMRRATKGRYSRAASGQSGCPSSLGITL